MAVLLWRCWHGSQWWWWVLVMSVSVGVSVRRRLRLMLVLIHCHYKHWLISTFIQLLVPSHEHHTRTHTLIFISVFLRVRSNMKRIACASLHTCKNHDHRRKKGSSSRGHDAMSWLGIFLHEKYYHGKHATELRTATWGRRQCWVVVIFWGWNI